MKNPNLEQWPEADETRLKHLLLWSWFAKSAKHIFLKSPSRLMVTAFALAILLGTVLLKLPLSHYGQVSLLDALFTATSAVCVTGLIVMETGQDFTPFGQIVILTMIQAGGLGIMTFAAIAFKISGARLPLSQQFALEESLFQRNAAAEFRHVFPRILKIVVVIQTAGFLILAWGFLQDFPAGHALYSAMFHTVSAFCNAGFSIYEDSLIGLRDNTLVVAITMVLIVLGGLGQVVLIDLFTQIRNMFQRKARKHLHVLNFHTRVTLRFTLILLTGGAIALWVCGIQETSSPDSPPIVAAVFQSVTARTAGFNTVDIGAMPLPSLLILSLLMFIGGSPGSSAGGIKTTTFAVWLARFRAALLGRKNVTLMGRTMSPDLVLRVMAVIGIAIVWNALGVFILSVLLPQDTALHEIFFEQISAFGTVGLSTGLTPKLTEASRVWIIMSMFVGRLGPLTLALYFFETKHPSVTPAEGRVMI